MLTLSPRRNPRIGPLATCVVFSLLAVVSAQAQGGERADCRVFHSTVLKSVVRYCVLLPASYSTPEAKHRRYPVLYLLHGLGGTHQTVAFDGEWGALQDLRRDNKVGEFLVVSPEAWDTFYIDSRDGFTPYSDFFLNEFIPHIERVYRVRATRATRGITGFSMGGYGALRFAFAHPELFGAVSAHSAAMMREQPPDPQAIISPGNMAAETLTKTFGDPIDKKFWNLNSPYVLARKNAAALMNMKIYFDCGTEDAFGLARGASELDATLNAVKVPHEFHLYPGGHTQDYLLAHIDATFEFHWREFASAK